MKGFCSVPRPPDCSEGFVRCGSVRQFEPILDTQQVVGARPANQGFRALEIDFRRGHFGERFNLFSQPGHHTGVPSPSDLVLIPPAGAQQISPCKPGHQRVADSWRDSAIVPAGGLAVVGKPSRNACRLLVCLVPQKQGPFLRGSSVCSRLDLLRVVERHSSSSLWHRTGKIGIKHYDWAGNVKKFMDHLSMRRCPRLLPASRTCGSKTATAGITPLTRN